MSDTLSYKEFIKAIKGNDIENDIAGHIMFIDYVAQTSKNFPDHLKFDYLKAASIPQFSAFIKARITNKEFPEVIGYIKDNMNDFFTNPTTVDSANKLQEFLRPFFPIIEQLYKK